MKVVILGPSHPYRGGIADTNHSMASTFEALGHDVTLVTFTLQYPSFLFPGKNQFSKEEKPDLNIERKVNSINPISWIRTAKYINNLDPDIVIIRYWMPYLAPALGFISRRLKAKRKIGMCDNVLPHEKRLFDHSLTRYFLNSVNEYVTLSSHVAEELRSFNKEHVKALFHPINLNLLPGIDQMEARKTLGLDSEKKYILFFGLVRNYKGLDLLIQSLAHLQSNDIKLIIAGEFYEPIEKYTKLIAQHNLGEQVIIKNEFIPENDIPLYFSAADFLGMTYKTASQSGISQLAFHYKLPILATDIGGLKEMVAHDHVGLCAPLDPKEISKSILLMLEDERLNRYRENLNEEVKKYSWESFVKKLIA